MLGNTLRNVTLATIVLSVGAAYALAAPSPSATAGKPASAALDRFKALAGEWVAAEDSEMFKKGDLVARYAVTAAGSAVVETIFPASRTRWSRCTMPTVPTWC